MTNSQILLLILDYTIKIIAVGVVPGGRKPSAANAWLLLILTIPLLGLPLYLIWGSKYIDRRRHEIQQRAIAIIGAATADQHNPHINPEIDAIMRLNRALTGFPATESTITHLYTDYREALLTLTDAVERAQRSVDIEIYITSWDDYTDPFFQACARAVQRGVTVRLLFDHLGTLPYPGYIKLAGRLREIGVEAYAMLPFRPWKWRIRRPDLRNHRKLMVIDDEVAYLGSLNMIDPSYLKHKHTRRSRQWVDAMIEVRGPIVGAIHSVFAVDWFTESGEELPLIERTPHSGNATVQLVPSGPGYTTEPNLRMFTALVNEAKHRLILCSPYFIPDEALLQAVTSAAYRGVQVQLLVNEKADQFIVGHAQSSYYDTLLRAGIEIHQYPAPFVLHTKFMVVDPGEDALAVFGSSNMDMRSFGLNYEISLFAHGPFTDQLTALANQYIGRSRRLTLEKWSERGVLRRYVDNVMRLTSAVQ